MSILRETKHITDQLKADIRAEVVSVDLIEEGIVDEIYIKPLGTFHRNYRRDIMEEYEEISDEGEKIASYWHVSREGFYDMLPEGLFHQPKRDPYKNTQAMINEYKRQQEEEKDARTFFLPFEQAFFQQRLHLEDYERKALLGFADDSQQKWLKEFWGIEVPLTKAQMTVLMYLLPIAHRLTGKWDLIAKSFELILGVEVGVQHQAPQVQDAKGFGQVILGEGSLGIDFIIGQEFCDNIPDIEITIGLISKSLLPEFLDQGKQKKILDMLCEYFIPVEYFIHINIEVKEGENSFELSDEKYAARLGYTTVC